MSFVTATTRKCENIMAKCLLIIAFFDVAETITQVYSIKGSSVQLNCPHRAMSPKELKWYYSLVLSNTVWSTYTINQKLNDKVPAYPRFNVTGDFNSGEYNLVINNLRREDEGYYRCTLSNNALESEQKLIIVEGPTNTTIASKTQDNKLKGREDQDLTISCTAVGGDPAPDMVLQIRNQNRTAESSRTIQHTISPDRTYDGATVICLAGSQSLSYFPVTDTATIYLILNPLPPTFSPDPVVTVDTKPLSVTCTSTGGRPEPTERKWTIGSADVTSYSTVISPTQNPVTVMSTLTYSVDRSNNGEMLSCGFRNDAAGSFIFSTRKMDIKFSPSVSVENKTFNPSDVSRQINCVANGNPETYKYLKWQHKSKYGTVIRTLDGNNTLTLQAASDETRYQDTGEYVCTVSNGIKDRNGTVNQQSSGFVISQASPVFLNGDQHTRFGQTKKDVDINVDVYSQPMYNSLIWKKGSNIISSSTKYTLSNVTAIMRDTFHGTEVEIDGYKLILTIHNLEQQDFVNYTLSLSNGVGEAVEHLVILMSASPPNTPTNFTQVHATESTVTLTWLPGFDGGQEQTFVVEYRTAESSDWTKAIVPKHLQTSNDDLPTYVLSGLEDGTLYEIRMYAQNKFNNSEATDIVTISTKESSGLGAIIGAVVGVLVVLVIIVVIVAIVFVRKRINENGPKKIPRSESDSDGEDGLKDNILYKSVDTGSSKPPEAAPSEYAEVQKRNDVYAEVSKPKQQKDTKEKNKKEKKSPGKKKQKSKAINNNSAAKEYTNQSEYGNVNNPTGGYKNADGLQYADITFIQPPKTKTGKTGKPVIHGLDDRTIYCDVDHTKKAPPLPQEGAYELTDMGKEKQS